MTAVGDDYKYPHSVKSLDVIPPANAKVEQLKAELNAEARTAGGLTPAPATPEVKVEAGGNDPARSIQKKLLEGKVIEACRAVYDPEIPVNIYDLGLIYEIAIDDENRVDVKMTLTAPGCPVAGSLPAEVQMRIQQVPEVKSADVTLVWDPPWDKSRMSEAALLDLGM